MPPIPKLIPDRKPRPEKQRGLEQLKELERQNEKFWKEHNRKKQEESSR